MRHGPSPVVPNSHEPVWDYTFPRPISWKLGDPVVVKIIDTDWSNSTIYTITSTKDDPLALRLISGTLSPSKGGKTKLVFASRLHNSSTAQARNGLAVMWGSRRTFLSALSSEWQPRKAQCKSWDRLRRLHAGFSHYSDGNATNPRDRILCRLPAVGPRALPWALLNRPFRAKNQPSAPNELPRVVLAPRGPSHVCRLMHCRLSRVHPPLVSLLGIPFGSAFASRKRF